MSVPLHRHEMLCDRAPDWAACERADPIEEFSHMLRSYRPGGACRPVAGDNPRGRMPDSHSPLIGGAAAPSVSTT